MWVLLMLYRFYLTLDLAKQIHISGYFNIWTQLTLEVHFAITFSLKCGILKSALSVTARHTFMVYM